MTWTPKEAQSMLNHSGIVLSTRSVVKISGYKFRSGRELVLLTENTSKVSIYVDIAPMNMPDVVIQQEYNPTSSRSGRHADIESVARTLGYSYRTYRLNVISPRGLELLLNWLKYA
jgi:hypothetical protein